MKRGMTPDGQRYTLNEFGEKNVDLPFDDVPLTTDEKVILMRAGWHFASDTYIYADDEQMADGIKAIRHVLDGIIKYGNECP
jgi:hypothetical protein